jgi:hypothetical protein
VAARVGELIVASARARSMQVSEGPKAPMNHAHSWRRSEPLMPARVDRIITLTAATDPQMKLIYVEAVREDAYFLSHEDGHSVLFVHPMHRSRPRVSVAHR